ncbi:MAG TPA: ABC transporter permease subunit [Pirellulales bacterium]|nr:ABC transporter permease subunit [Pirellulales bacterium]
MNRALWSKAIADARLLLAGLTVLLFAFHWIFIWLTSLFKPEALDTIYKSIPPQFQLLLAVSLDKMMSPTSRVAMAYLDPVVVFATVTWGIARGSDCVSGEIGRGTMEMLLAQPVRRVTIVVTHAVVTTVGSAILALASWLGTCQGLAHVEFGKQVSRADFVPAAVNLFALMFFLAAASTLVSACDSVRWRTIGVMGAFYAVELVLKIIARVAPSYHWMMYATFLGAYEPQVMIIEPQQAWELSLSHDGTLIGLGLGCYLLAAAVFARRDLPAPL